MSKTETPFRVIGPSGSAPDSALVFDSPHSWRDWPTSGVQPIVGEDALLTSWDAFMDDMWSEAADGRAPVLAAHFHRAYIDVNRARDDIDPEMIHGVWPGTLRPTKKSQAGMGLIRRFALPGIPIYDSPLSVDEVMHRIDTFYDPYHAALSGLVNAAAEQFGFVCHIDCHSMKSIGNAMNDDGGQVRPDMVVSDRDGVTASPLLTDRIAAGLEAQGFKVQVNHPYKGAELVQRHGNPLKGHHSVQIEVNRALYMDERRFIKTDKFSGITDQIRRFVKELRHDLDGELGAKLTPNQSSTAAA